jgi:polysaccharide export outer membrane protein
MITNNKLRIFLVDDDSYCVNIYKQHLSNLGYTDVTTFSSGPEYLNNLTQTPGVIFLDHGMDYITGLEVLRKIKQSNPEIIVVFLSGEANILTAVKALKLGAIDYIVKGRNELENITKVLNKIAAIMVSKCGKGEMPAWC